MFQTNYLPQRTQRSQRTSLYRIPSCSLCPLWLQILRRTTLSHAALFILFAAAARTGIIAADFRFQVADWFDFSIGLCAGDGRLLLAFDFAGGSGLFLDRLRFDPSAADEA